MIGAMRRFRRARASDLRAGNGVASLTVSRRGEVRVAPPNRLQSWRRTTLSKGLECRP